MKLSFLLPGLYFQCDTNGTHGSIVLIQFFNDTFNIVIAGMGVIGNHFG